MKKRILLIVTVFLAASLVIGYCVFGLEGKETGVNTTYPLTDTPHIHTAAKEEQSKETGVQGYCGNTITKITIDGMEYTFWGGDSVTLTDMLLNLDYSEKEMCSCPAEIKIDTEFGLGYGINLSKSFARSEKGQVDLTEEQVKEIKAIIDRQCK